MGWSSGTLYRWDGLHGSNIDGMVGLHGRNIDGMVFRDVI